MLYNEDLKFAYLHIHKTGGMALREFLLFRVPGTKNFHELPDFHYTVKELYQVLPFVQAYTIFATVRQPLAHLVSIYHFWRSLPYDRGTQLDQLHISLAKNTSFSSFVDVYINAPMHFYDFSAFLCIDKVLPPNVYVLRQEHLEADVVELFNKMEIDIPVKLPVKNTSEHGPYLGYYSRELAERVEARYSWIFEQGVYERLAGLLV